MPNFKNSNGWDELKPAVFGFIGLFLILSSFPALFVIPSFFPGAEGMIIGYATSLASALTGSLIWYKFRKSD
jgi:hypothetical protein